MKRHNTALRRAGIVLTGALLLGMLQSAPALAAPLETPVAGPSDSAPVTDADVQSPPVVRSQGDDMVGGTDEAGTNDLLQADDESVNGVEPLAAATPSNHTVNVAVVAPKGTSVGTEFISDAAIADLLAKVGASWKTQSNGQVQSVAVSGAIQRYASAYTCGEQVASWGEAAAKFGHTSRYDYSSTASVHLLVLVPSTCPASGLGSVGINGVTVSAGYGGVMWVSLKGYGDVDTVTHEFGHNLGLNHSNSHQCPVTTLSEGEIDPTTGAFSDGCSDYAYGDNYDVMGPTWSVGGPNGIVYTNARPTSLNVTHKLRLGAMSSGEMQAVTLPTGSAALQKSFALASVGLTSGLRDIAVTDPRTGSLYYVDFRGGGGTDTDSLYATGKLSTVGTAIGVRILTTRPSGASIVLNSPEKAPRTGSKLYLLAGERLSTRSGGMTVSVSSVAGGVATVSVALAANPGTPTPTPTPTPKVTVAFNTQGGSAVAAVSVNTGSVIKAPTSPTRTGYTFKGWYTTATGSTAWNFAGKVTANVTAYAQWTIQKRTVSFNTQGGNAVAAVSVNYGSVIKAPTSPTRTGYTFKGWYTTATGSTAWNFAGKVTANVTAYAQWTVQKRTVSFNTQGGSAVAAVSVNTGSVIKAPTSPTRTGYRFKGWYTTATGSTAWNFAGKVTANVTAYAQWTMQKRTVSFNSQGGSKVAPVSVNYGSVIKAPTSPTRTGYTFKGWYTTATGSTVRSFTAKVTANATAYAQWTVQKRTIAFNAQGGSTVAAVKVNYGTVIKAPTSPTRTGYTFKGWYTKSSAGSAWNFTAKVTANATAYARWAKK